MTEQPLRDLVTQRLDVRWSDFCRDHPNLAAAIDRCTLVEQAVAHLRHDPRFRAALREAELDEARLCAAARALEQVERVVTLLLPR